MVCFFALVAIVLSIVRYCGKIYKRYLVECDGLTEFDVVIALCLNQALHCPFVGLRTFALIVSAHPYCTRKFTSDVIHERAR